MPHKGAKSTKVFRIFVPLVLNPEYRYSMRMLEQIDLEQTIDKRTYKQRLPDLEQRLYHVEQTIVEARIPVLIVFEGWAGTSKIGAITALTHRMDPRGLRVHPVTPPRTWETQYPWFYRFWLKIPPYGQIAIFDRSWYREVLAERTGKKASQEAWRRRCEEIAAFERQLADDGALILKLWLHISKKEQRERFRKLTDDPVTAWQVTDDDRWQQRHYKRVRSAVEDLIARTHTHYAPWVVLPATDPRYAQIAAFETLVSAVEARLGPMASTQSGVHDGLDFDGGSHAFRELKSLPGRPALVAAASPPSENGHASPPSATTRLLQPGESSAPAVDQAATDIPAILGPGILGAVDLSQKLDEETYGRKLRRLQAKIHLLGLEVYRRKRPVVLVFEGWDAAGKGGAIQRITDQLDPRSYIVHAIAAPSGDDRQRQYLYRFWRRLPPTGQIAIFDRSWYGRVLVERVEGFARPDEWQRAYAEINEFEHQLIDFGTIVCKFWLQLSPEEQLRRFEDRRNVPYKAWKLTDEDWRNREKWPQYTEAADEMLLRTSTPAAPWTIVEAEDKRFARIKVLRTVVQRLEAELGKIKL